METSSSDAKRYLQRLSRIPGVISAAFVDINNGRVLDCIDSEWNVHLPVVARGFAQMLRVQAEVTRRFQFDDQLATIQIVLGNECHVFSHMAHNEQVFLMAVGLVQETNVGLLRFNVENIAKSAIINTV